MGLDQYAYSQQPNTTPDFQWRKHYGLHNWMVALGTSRGIEDVNCVPIKLREEDIAALKKAMTKDDFYSSDDLVDQRAQNADFISWAESELKSGMEVWYDCWY
jgi:hypothetical protein